MRSNVVNGPWRPKLQPDQGFVSKIINIVTIAWTWKLRTDIKRQNRIDPVGQSYNLIESDVFMTFHNMALDLLLYMHIA